MEKNAKNFIGDLKIWKFTTKRYSNYILKSLPQMQQGFVAPTFIFKLFNIFKKMKNLGVNRTNATLTSG